MPVPFLRPSSLYFQLALPSVEGMEWEGRANGFFWYKNKGKGLLFRIALSPTGGYCYLRVTYLTILVGSIRFEMKISSIYGRAASYPMDAR